MRPAFAVDLEALARAHERAILQVHPDRFAGRPAAERRVAEQWAARINEAYALLQSPVRRAGWLCEAAGVPVEAETHTRMPADFLMEQMAWREALENAADEKAREAVRAEARARAGLITEALRTAIDEQGDYAAAAELTRRLMFVERFLEQAARA